MIVWIWTGAAVVGSVISAWNLQDAWRDLRALDATHNGRRILNVGWVRREAIRFGIQAIWATIGFLALPTASNTVNPIVILLVGTNVALAASTFLDARERRILREIIA